MSDSSFTFFSTSSSPASAEYSSGGESSSRARLVEKPTCAITTERSGWAARVLRSTAVALGAERPESRSWGKRKLSSVFLARQRQVSALFDHASLADDTDRNVAAAVECVDRVDKRSRKLMIDADRNGQQAARAARLKRVNHPERQHVVAIAADVGIEDQAAPVRVVALRPLTEPTPTQPDRRSS